MKARNTKRPLALSATLLLIDASLSGALVGGGAVVANAAEASPTAEPTTTSTDTDTSSPTPSESESDESSEPTETSTSPTPTPTKTCKEIKTIDPRGLDLKGGSGEAAYTVSKTTSDKNDRVEIANAYPPDLNGCAFAVTKDGSNDTLPVVIGNDKPKIDALAERTYRLNDKSGDPISAENIDLSQNKETGKFSYTENGDNKSSTPAPSPSKSSSQEPEPNPSDPDPTKKPSTNAPEPTASPSDPSDEGDDPSPVPKPSKPSDSPTHGNGPGDPNNGNGNGGSAEPTDGTSTADDYSDPVPRGPDSSENPDAINDETNSDGDGWDTGPATADATNTQAKDDQLTSGLGSLPWSLAAVVGIGALAILLAFLVLGRKSRKDPK